jgi:hypothetical protein
MVQEHRVRSRTDVCMQELLARHTETGGVSLEMLFGGTSVR